MSLGIGLIGAGGMGARHASTVHREVAQARITAVFDPNAARARAVSAEVGASIADAAPDLIARDDVGAVIIASPDETHADFTMNCVNLGKPVLCEKPMARSRQAAWDIVKREEEVGRRLVGLGFMRRFDPYHLAVKTALDENEIGRPIAVKGVHRTAELPPGYGPNFAISASAVHDIDAARWLLDEEITEIRATGRRVSPALAPGTLDLVFLEAKFTGNCYGLFEVFQTAGYGYDVVAEVVGETNFVTTSMAPAKHLPAGCSESPIKADDWFARFERAYVDEIRAFSTAVAGSKSFSGASAWDGFVAVAAADAALASIKSGRAERIELPDQPALYLTA